MAATTATATSGGGGSRHSLEHLLQHGHQQGQLCPHHAVHFASAYDVRRSSASYSADNYSSGESSYEAAYRVHTKTSSPPPLFGKLVGTVAKHFLSDERDRKYYADMYSCMPPPIFILTITLVELIFFSYYAIANQTGPVTPNGPIPIDSLFIYRPDRKVEIWRFFLYMVLHAGWLHLLFNLLVQLLVGLPLEMVHGSTRIGVVYMSGVLAGSLATSVFDSEVYLVGASGGVYALLAAHLANVLLNYNQIELGFVRLVGVFVVVSVDVGIAIYNRYAASAMAHDGGSVSYVAHLAGAAAGLTIGLLVLKNFEQKLHEQLVWWVALGVYVACILFALVFNLMETVTSRALHGPLFFTMYLW
ncbi:PREDICTED: protein rhomboid-like [Rhagoletis zephyria]|uniref:protein rhomboid-like n=1 Tax=Rhagoletis zephyria TaxID=28612 RepID=UPI0008114957|nr:PREDICTED: protein rhomboid-like [Rhagoletis zephyria]